MAWNLTTLFAQTTTAQTTVAELSAADPAPADESGMAWYFIVMILAAVTVIPFVLGDRLAKAFRMKDYAWKFGLILTSLACGIAVVCLGTLRYGIDLSGGVILVYEID